MGDRTTGARPIIWKAASPVEMRLSEKGTKVRMKKVIRYLQDQGMFYTQPATTTCHHSFPPPYFPTPLFYCLHFDPSAELTSLQLCKPRTKNTRGQHICRRRPKNHNSGHDTVAHPTTRISIPPTTSHVPITPVPPRTAFPLTQPPAPLEDTSAHQNQTVSATLRHQRSRRNSSATSHDISTRRITSYSLTSCTSLRLTRPTSPTKQDQSTGSCTSTADTSATRASRAQVSTLHYHN